MQIFFSRQGRLLPVGTVVKAPVTVSDVLDALLAGPTNAETTAGVQSAISDQTSLLSVHVRSGVAYVDLSAVFSAIGGKDQILAIAQVVFTATEVAGVQSVAFSLAGNSVEVPTGDGTLVQRPVTRADFPQVAPA